MHYLQATIMSANNILCSQLTVSAKKAIKPELLYTDNKFHALKNLKEALFDVKPS